VCPFSISPRLSRADPGRLSVRGLWDRVTVRLEWLNNRARTLTRLSAQNQTRHLGARCCSAPPSDMFWFSESIPTLLHKATERWENLLEWAKLLLESTMNGSLPAPPRLPTSPSGITVSPKASPAPAQRSCPNPSLSTEHPHFPDGYVKLSRSCGDI